jgi:hypothetical protein
MKLTATSKEYEELTQAIYSEILKLEGFNNIDVQHNVRLTDARYTGKRSLVQWLDFSVHSKAGVNVPEEIELKPESANVIFKGEQIGKIESVVLENVSRVTNKRINIDAKEIVAAVLEDTATGAIEHTKLKPASS